MDTRDFSTRCTCATLRMAARRLSQLYDTALAPQGLKTSQYSILCALQSWRGDMPTVQALADRLALDRTTLGHNLRPLERDGYVTVRSDTQDGRVRRIGLTETGLAKRLACFPLWQAAQEHFEAAFGRDHSDNLQQALMRIVRGPEASPLNPKSENRNHAG